MARGLALVLGAIALLATRPLGAQTNNTAGGVPPQPQTPTASGIQHIIWIWFENRETTQITQASAPYFTAFAAANVNLTNFYAVTHPSQPNYLDAFSGSNQGITGDGYCTFPASTDNLAKQLAAAGKSWRVYAQDYPGSCSDVQTFAGGVDGPGVAGTYVRKHNPVMGFESVRLDSVQCANIQHLASFDPTVNFAFVAPNLINDMHDGTIAQGDAFLQAFVPLVTASPDWAHTLLIVTFDEGTTNTNGGGHVYTAAAAPWLAHANVATTYNHFSVLRTIEQVFGLPFLGAAATATTITELLPPAATPTPTPSATPTATHFAVSAPGAVTQYFPFNVTVTALDQFNNTVTNYPGTVHFTSTSSGNGTHLPPDGTLTNGTGIFSVMLGTPGNQTVTATDTSNPSITGTSNPIFVNAKGSPTPSPTPTPCGTSTFSNPAAITINDAGVAAPYPSNITVSGITNPVIKVTVSLTGFNHTFPSDVDMLVVGPSGQKFILVSDVIGGTDAVGINWAFDDAAAAFIGSTGTPASGTFKPTNYTTCQDPFAAPAPAGPYLSPGGEGAPCGTDTLAAFNGVNPNGTWSLYVVDDLGGDVGTISGGWSLSITISGACGTPTPSPTGTPTTPTPTPPATPTPSPSTSPALTPTPTPPTPTPTPSTPTPTPTPSTPTPTPTPPTPTPTPPAPTPTPTPSATPAAQALNLSTRMRVQTGDNVGIGGFIVTGTGPKHVLLRAIGPSLTGSGVPDALADPVLELHGPSPFVTVIDDNWKDDPAQEALIIASGIQPTNDFESAIDATLVPGIYTAIIRGKNNTLGVGLVEVYDLSQTAPAKLANISTRAFVSTGSNIVIGGFFLGGGNANDRVAVRGIGPSLTAQGVPNALADPTLELRDGNGAILVSNNDWQDNPVQASELIAAGLAPTNDLESGIATTLPPGPYTALLAGLNDGVGVGLVEVYDRGAP